MTFKLALEVMKDITREVQSRPRGTAWYSAEAGELHGLYRMPSVALWLRSKVLKAWRMESEDMKWLELNYKLRFLKACLRSTNFRQWKIIKHFEIQQRLLKKLCVCNG